jgi:lincosamide nucleotidyltransferase A/C/D/E
VNADDVLDVLRALQGSDLLVWLDGGWGVDALLGDETRLHDDVDIVVELDALVHVLMTLESLGFHLAEDHLPTRAVLRSCDGRQIDLHPVVFADDGAGWQRGGSPDGSDLAYSAEGFGYGPIRDRAVPCLTADLQLEHHRGYEPTDRDVGDMRRLADRFNLVLPEPY